MANREEIDRLYAQQLQDQFDKECLEITSDEEDVCFVDSVQRDHRIAAKLQLKYEKEAVELLSDSDDDVILQAVVKEESTISESEIPPNNHNFNTETKPAYLNNREYFIEELQVYVDPENNFEWKFIEVLPDIRAIFEKFDELFFQSRFKAKKFMIVWSESMGNTCTNRNFNDDEGRYTIALNAPLLVLRPRIEIMSIILHEMIHALLKLEGIKEPNNGHGNNFRKIMLHLNTMLQTRISFNHKLSEVDRNCRTQWYRCTGICHNYKPFSGIVRSIEGPPGLHNEWWKEHADSCGGTFYKIYEMAKIIEGSISTRYAVNVKYMLPKRENIRGRFKTKLPPTESIDLTSDVPRIISSTQLETISLDADDPVNTIAGVQVADKFIDYFCRTIAFTRDANEMQCPICQERIKRKLFSSHIDGCKGFVRHVSWKRSANGRIVQNGLLELKAKPGLDTTPAVHRAHPHTRDSFRPSSSSMATSSYSSYESYEQVKKKRFG